MRSKISLLMMSIVVLLSSMAVLPVYAGDATVTDCTNFTGAGTISQAVADANNGGGTISVTCTGTIIFEDELTITADVILNNDGGGEVIFDETGDDNRFFFVDDGVSLTLNGFILQNGNSLNDFGGAIYNYNGTLTISNSTFMGNSADFGGGAITNFGTLTISNSTFTGNLAENDGGAIFNGYENTLTITDSSFTDNSANESGGAIIN
ncbi:MAG: hypothetical protein KJ043_21250, partial [Anaerolineae bacterium]|nr:hypothetical protein [Anaerolineae bacterium]